MKEKKVSQIPFSDAIKTAKVNNNLNFQPSLPHPATVNFLNGIYKEGYDHNGFLIEAKKPSKTKGKANQVKVAMQKD